MRCHRNPSEHECNGEPYIGEFIVVPGSAVGIGTHSHKVGDEADVVQYEDAVAEFCQDPLVGVLLNIFIDVRAAHKPER